MLQESDVHNGQYGLRKWLFYHEMGHVEYILAYRKANFMLKFMQLEIIKIFKMMSWGFMLQHQPLSFREGVNGAFHEAFGDTIHLSFITPKHLHAVDFSQQCLIIVMATAHTKASTFKKNWSQHSTHASWW